MKCTVLLLLVLIGLVAALEMDCPRPEWKKRRANNHCYWFEDGDHLPQYKADERCRRYHGKLVTINDQNENDWILKNVMPPVPTQPPTQPPAGQVGGDSRYFYIGLKRDDTDNTKWRWELDGTLLDWGGYWMEGEPNNYHKKENCVTYFEETGKWNDVMCGDSFHYICEYVIPPPPPTTAAP